MRLLNPAPFRVGCSILRLFASGRLELLGSLTKGCTSTAAEEKQQQTKGAPSSKKVIRHGRPLALGIGSIGDFSGGGDAKGGRWCR